MRLYLYFSLVEFWCKLKYKNPVKAIYESDIARDGKYEINVRVLMQQIVRHEHYHICPVVNLSFELCYAKTMIYL